MTKIIDGANAGVRQRAQHGSAALLNHVRARISDRTWPAGYRLPPERELVLQFGLARNTLRKAMDQLESEGLIYRHVGRGTFVSESDSPMATTEESLLQRIHGASPADVMELRLLLEPQFVELAATRANSRDMQQIAHCLAQSEAAEGVLEFEYWDGMLHQSILAAVHNNLLTDLYEAINGVRKQPEWEALKRRSLTPGRHKRYMEQHREIVHALKNRDGEVAAERIRAHLLEVRAGMSGED